MNAMDTANAARGRWPGILAALGIDPRYLTNTQGPCPICGGKTRFRFPDDLNGTWFCNKCFAHGDKGPHDGFELLKRVHGWDFKKAASEVDRVINNCPITTEKNQEKTDKEKSKACRELLEAAGRVVPGTPAYAYLLSRCGNLDGVLGDLRSHPGIKHTTSGGTHPALLGIMRYPCGGGASVHRTYLTRDGQKAMVDPVRKMMPGLPLKGSCIRLGAMAETIGIAEGIETAICAGKLFGLTVWAATCAGLMKTWEPPQGIKRVVIFADNDSNFTGQDAALDLARELCRLGIEWDIKIPHKVGTDWADVWAQQQTMEAA